MPTLCLLKQGTAKGLRTSSTLMGVKKDRCFAAGLRFGDGFYGAYLRCSSAGSTTEWRCGFYRDSSSGV